MAKYIPRVIICGDVAKFRDTVGSAEIVGQVTFTKTGNEIQLLYGGQPLTGDNIRQLLDGTAEYLLFTDALNPLRSWDKYFFGGRAANQKFFTTVNRSTIKLFAICPTTSRNIYCSPTRYNSTIILKSSRRTRR